MAFGWPRLLNVRYRAYINLIFGSLVSLVAHAYVFWLAL